MPRTKAQFEEMRKATKEKIQSSAMQLFVLKGFGSTNVQEIADKAEISVGLMYRHYKTKDELFDELVEFALGGLRKTIDLFESDESPNKLINQFVHDVYNDMISGNELANLTILMTQSFFVKGEANQDENEVAQVNAMLLQATSNLIKRGQEMGEFGTGESYEMALYFFSAIQGLAEMKVLLRSNFSMPSPTILTAFLYTKGE